MIENEIILNLSAKQKLLPDKLPIISMMTISNDDIYETARILDEYIDELLGPQHHFRELRIVIQNEPHTSPVIVEIHRLLHDVELLDNDKPISLHVFEYIVPLKRFYQMLKSWCRDDGFVDPDKIPEQYKQLNLKYINRLRFEILYQEPLIHK